MYEVCLIITIMIIIIILNINVSEILEPKITNIIILNRVSCLFFEMQTKQEKKHEQASKQRRNHEQKYYDYNGNFKNKSI